jgi:hypothetical protein
VRNSLKVVASCIAACGLGVGIAAVALPGGVATVASSPAVGATASRGTNGSAPNLPAPGPHHALVSGVNTTSAESYNWSGYAAVGPTNQYFTKVIGSWTVTAVTCTPEDRSLSAWVGLDGVTNATVEQLGTSAQCFEGSPVYSSWYEMYPSGEIQVGTKVKPGDKITASVVRTGTSYKFVLTDATTTGNNISVTQSCALATCQDLSAEWIVERPSYISTGVLPLSQFHPMQFTAATASGGTTTNGPVTAFPTSYQLQMVDSTGSYPLTAIGALNATGKAFGDSWVNSY